MGLSSQEGEGSGMGRQLRLWQPKRFLGWDGAWAVRSEEDREGGGAWLQKPWAGDHHSRHPNHALVILIKIIYVM